VSVRERLAISEDSYLEVTADGDEVRMRKVVSARPLSDEDPMWELLGSAASGDASTAEDHDRQLAEAEIAGWSES